jgi:hypothetical protein
MQQREAAIKRETDELKALLTANTDARVRAGSP